MKLTVIGIGYSKDDITKAGLNALEKADTVIVKSVKHTLPDEINAKEYTALDYVYEQAKDFDELDMSLAAEVKRLARGNTVYLVPGDGVSDNSLKHLDKYALVKGVSHKPDGVFESFAVMSATDISATARLNIDTDIPLVVTEIDNAILASDVKLKLLELYAEDARTGFMGKNTVLEDLDRQKKYGYNTYAVIYPAALTAKKRFNLNDLLNIMDTLCAPGGCPWDRAQTHESIKINIIEEAYEAVDAIESGDLDNMAEEFGDLLLQAVFQSTISERTGEFTLYDVISGLCAKLISRHTHVFGEVKAANPDEALKSWDAAKSVEKGQDTVTSAIEALPKSFPALLRAVKVQKKAKKGGLDFASSGDAVESLKSEIEEFCAAKTEHEKYDETGDILFSVCNVARLNGIEPETALNSAINKFFSRLKSVEAEIVSSGKNMRDCSAEELDLLWKKYKHTARFE